MFLGAFRLALSAIAIAGLWIVFEAGRRADVANAAAADFAALADVDFRLLAEEYWAGGNAEAALACLEYVISNDMADAPASRILYNKYLAQIRARKSALGRLSAVGKGFLLGEVDGADALAGSVLADLVVYGDVRDIVREGLVKEDGNGFVLAMASLGLASTAFPPADSSVSLLKLLAKTGSLSEPLKRVFIKCAKTAAEAVKNPSKNAGAVAEVRTALEPVAELSKCSRSWTQFASVMKYAETSKDISAAAKLIGKDPSNARKLEQILTLSRFRAPDMFRAIMRTGQFGMDRIYAALRKGPAGLSLLGKHPAFAARAAKNSAKAYPLIMDFLSLEIAKAAGLKYAAYGLLCAVLAFAAFSPRGIYRFARSQGAGAAKSAFAVAAFIFAGAALFFGLACYADLKLSERGGGSAQASGAQNGRAGLNAYLGYATWNVDARIDAGRWFLDSFESAFCAPMIKTGRGVFIACDSKNLGLFWKDSAKGRVFNLEISAQRRGDNPLSFIPDEIFVCKANPRLALIRVPEKFSEELSLAAFDSRELPKGERPVLFVSENGFSSRSPTLSVENGEFALYVKAGAKVGDFVVTTPRGLFLGIVSEAAGEGADAALGVFLPESFGADSFESVSLKKAEKEKYFSDFSAAASRIQKGK